MRADVLPYLRCPVCGSGLAPLPGAVRCGRGHSFDVARQGYLNLASGPPRHPGDTPAMVAARADFLAAGHYAFIAEALAGTAAALAGTTADAPGPPPGLVLDVGAGTGYFLARVLDALPDRLGLALDSAKPAVRRAARAHPRGSAVVCDAWRRLPVADAAAALVLNVFAPRNVEEFRRVLAPGGRLLVVTPEPDHLAELVERAGLLGIDPTKQDRLLRTLGTPETGQRLTRTLELARPDLLALVAMGPSARHVDPAAAAALPAPFRATASVRLGVYRLS